MLFWQLGIAGVSIYHSRAILILFKRVSGMSYSLTTSGANLLLKNTGEFV